MREIAPNDVRHELNATFATFLLERDALPKSSDLYQDLEQDNQGELDWFYGPLKGEMHTIFEAKRTTPLE